MFSISFLILDGKFNIKHHQHILVVTVTNSTTHTAMVKNLIYYLNTNVSDPNSTARSSAESITNDNLWVKIKDGQSASYAPQILVEPPVGGGASTTTGLENQIRRPQVGIMFHARDIIEAMKYADLIMDALKQQIDNYFANAKMFSTSNYLTEPTYQPHESNPGEWYVKMYTNFEYFHYDAND